MAHDEEFDQRPVEYDTLYLIEKLGGAVDYLVTGKGDSRERLFVSLGYIRHLSIEETPEPIRDDLRWVLEWWRDRVEKLTDEYDCREFSRSIRRATASQIAGRIFSIYRRCVAAHHTGIWPERS